MWAAMQLPLATADAQLAAIEAVTKRSDRLTKRVGACIVGPAVPACFLAYAAIREVQFALWNINIAYLSVAVAAIVTVAPAIVVARHVCRALVHSRRGEWAKEEARRYGVPVECIMESFGEWA